jgi:hypothetical protein
MASVCTQPRAPELCEAKTLLDFLGPATRNNWRSFTKLEYLILNHLRFAGQPAEIATFRFA